MVWFLLACGIRLGAEGQWPRLGEAWPRAVQTLPKHICKSEFLGARGEGSGARCLCRDLPRESWVGLLQHPCGRVAIPGPAAQPRLGSDAQAEVASCFWKYFLLIYRCTWKLLRLFPFGGWLLGFVLLICWVLFWVCVLWDARLSGRATWLLVYNCFCTVVIKQLRLLHLTHLCRVICRFLLSVASISFTTTMNFYAYF